MNLAHR